MGRGVGEWPIVAGQVRNQSQQAYRQVPVVEVKAREHWLVKGNLKGELNL